MAIMVPYRSAGGARAVMARSLTSVANRGRLKSAPDPWRGIQPIRGGLGSLGCGCGCDDCGGGPHVSYEAARHGLGALGTSPLVGTAASAALSKGAAIGASSLLAAAGAGSFAGPVGAVVGVVIGILSQKLFGHANYAAVAHDVATRLQYAEAYKQVAGQYPGRLYGTDELKQIWYGLIHEGLFPKNPASAGWAPGAVCNIQACINGQRDKNGNCPGCGGSEGWANDLFTGSLVNQIQGFTGAVRQAVGQGITNPIQIADSILIPAWAPPDQGSKNIKWAYPGNSTNPSLIRQLMIDSLDDAEYNMNKSLPVFYGTVPGQQAQPTQSTVAIAAPTPPPPSAPPATAPSCPSLYVWNGSQCVMPQVQGPVSAQTPTSTAATTPTPTPTAPAAPTTGNAPNVAAVTGNWTQVGADAAGNAVFSDQKGVLYQWNGNSMVFFNGQLASGQSSAAQMQAAIQQALAQGATASQAAASAVAQAQATGVQVTPALQAQAADQAAITAAAPVSAGIFGAAGGSTGILIAGLAVVGLLVFAKRR